MSHNDTQKLILEEFGNCLLKVIHTASNRTGKKYTVERWILYRTLSTSCNATPLATGFGMPILFLLGIYIYIYYSGTRLLTLQTAHRRIWSFWSQKMRTYWDKMRTHLAVTWTPCVKFGPPYQTFNRLKSLSQHVQTTSVDKLYDFKPWNTHLVNTMCAIYELSKSRAHINWFLNWIRTHKSVARS